MAFWGLEVKPGKQPAVLNLERRLVVKQAALVVAKPDPTPCVLSSRGGAAGGARGQADESRAGELEGFIGLSSLSLVGADAAQFPPLCRNSQRAARHTRSAARTAALPRTAHRTDAPHRPRRRRQRW